MFATITPTRGDRPKFLEFCKFQLGRMNTRPDASYFIDYKPKSSAVDLIPRIKAGILKAKLDGFQYVMIFEDDDFFPKDYFDGVEELFNSGVEFIGSRNTTYYNLKNRTYQEWEHARHSSLFLTGFKIQALDDFLWPNDTEPFLDISLWLHAVNTRKKIAWRETKAIGIKHGIGLCGGRGHIQQNKYMDMNHEWLKANVDSEAFDFYKSIKF